MWHAATMMRRLCTTKFRLYFRQIDPLVAAEVWPYSLWRNKNGRVQMANSCFRPQAQTLRHLWDLPAAQGFKRAQRFIAPHLPIPWATLGLINPGFFWPCSKSRRSGWLPHVCRLQQARTYSEREPRIHDIQLYIFFFTILSAAVLSLSTYSPTCMRKYSRGPGLSH